MFALSTLIQCLAAPMSQTASAMLAGQGSMAVPALLVRLEPTSLTMAHRTAQIAGLASIPTSIITSEM